MTSWQNVVATQQPLILDDLSTQSLPIFWKPIGHHNKNFPVTIDITAQTPCVFFTYTIMILGSIIDIHF